MHAKVQNLNFRCLRFAPNKSMGVQAALDRAFLWQGHHELSSLWALGWRRSFEDEQIWKAQNLGISWIKFENCDDEDDETKKYKDNAIEYKLGGRQLITFWLRWINYSWWWWWWWLWWGWWWWWWWWWWWRWWLWWWWWWWWWWWYKKVWRQCNCIIWWTAVDRFWLRLIDYSWWWRLWW